MTDGPQIPYDHWVEGALCGVIRRALEYAAANGIPGDHHFYITFQTKAMGVKIPTSLLSEHPEEMTIVLQHQFEDLNIGQESISVKLYFDGKPVHLVIPFSAIVSFLDPSVNFGLQLKMTNDENGSTGLRLTQSETNGEPLSNSEGQRKELDKRKKVGEVITLDNFRKKT